MTGCNRVGQRKVGKVLVPNLRTAPGAELEEQDKCVMAFVLEMCL